MSDHRDPKPTVLPHVRVLDALSDPAADLSRLPGNCGLQFKPVRRPSGRLHCAVGGRAVTVRFTDGFHTKAVRVWYVVHHSLTEYYTRLERVLWGLDRGRLTGLVKFDFHPAGLVIESDDGTQAEKGDGRPVTRVPLPVQVMDWVEGECLSEWVRRAAAAGDRAGLRRVADNWRATMASWGAHSLAHGDPHPDNVLVTRSGEVRLIDYDSVYAPALADLPVYESGKPAFQHPCRPTRPHERQADFGGWVIDLALRAVAAEPGLFPQWFEGREAFPFVAADLRSPFNSPVWDRLRGSPDAGVRELTERVRTFAAGRFEDVPAFGVEPSSPPAPNPAKRGQGGGDLRPTPPSAPTPPQCRGGGDLRQLELEIRACDTTERFLALVAEWRTHRLSRDFEHEDHKLWSQLRSVIQPSLEQLLHETITANHVREIQILRVFRELWLTRLGPRTQSHWRRCLLARQRVRLMKEWDKCRANPVTPANDLRMCQVYDEGLLGECREADEFRQAVAQAKIRLDRRRLVREQVVQWRLGLVPLEAVTGPAADLPVGYARQPLEDELLADAFAGRGAKDGPPRRYPDRTAWEQALIALEQDHMLSELRKCKAKQSYVSDRECSHWFPDSLVEGGKRRDETFRLWRSIHDRVRRCDRAAHKLNDPQAGSPDFDAQILTDLGEMADHLDYFLPKLREQVTALVERSGLAARLRKILSDSRRSDSDVVVLSDRYVQAGGRIPAAWQKEAERARGRLALCVERAVRVSP